MSGTSYYLRRLFGCLFVLLVLRQAPALDVHKSLPQYAHRIWGQEEGLFQPTIYSILQTRDGIIWLGTQDSLLRFDGLHFRELDNSPKAAFHRSLVRDLAEDASGNLWAASVGSGLLRVAPGGQATHLTAKDGLPSNDVFCLDASTPGEVWACTNRGLARIRGSSVYTYTTDSGLPTNAVSGTCVSPDGTRWISGFDFGLARLSGARVSEYPDALLPRQSVSTLLCGKDGRVWAGTSTGLLQISPSGSRVFTTKDGLPDNEIYSLQGGPDGTLWIGTNDGISRLRNGEVSVYRTRDGLSHSVVYSLYEDREGTLWAGTKDGLDQFTDGNVTPFTQEEGLSGNDVGPVLEDGKGSLWVGTLGRGLNLFDGTRFRVLRKADGLADDTILSLAVDGAGDLWVGTKHGLNRVSNGKITASYRRREGLSGDRIQALFVDATGVLWAGSEGGLDRWNGVRFVKNNQLPGADAVSGIVALGGGRLSRLLISTATPAVYALVAGKPVRSTIDLVRPIDCYFVDGAHAETWMGTAGGGLLRYHNGTFTHVRVKDGLYDNRIYSIVQDNEANLWLASSKGIFRVSHKELDDFAEGRAASVTSIPFSTGQLRFECQSGVQPAGTRTRDGRLWFSTNNGLVMIDPNHLTTNTVTPPVRLSEVLINGKPTALRGNDELRLTPLERNLEIRYAGLSFVSPERVTFRTMLKGYEKEWTEAGTRREAFFTNLPPGHFEFQVSARNADGIWSTQPAALRFYITPRFYQHFWFFPTLAVLGALLAIAGFRMRVARLRRTFDLVLSERTRIARELHDTLLQGLSGITMQLQALWTGMSASSGKHTLLEIIQDAERCSKEARRSLWGLRNFGESRSGFEDKLQTLARRAVAAHPCSLHLELQPAISLDEFPEAEYQLLRIVQEVLSNALLHAAPQIVNVRLRADDGSLHLSVEDDGSGFDTEALGPFGHFGLIGMRERADEIGGILQVVSSPGQGTVVTLTLPLKRGLDTAKIDTELPASHQKG